MNFKFVPMNKEYADEIAYSWKYNGIYSFYDMTSDEDDLKEFLNEDGWAGHYFAVLDDRSELFGFYSFSFENRIMWVGVGLKPELTGQGIGYEFVKAGIRFGLEYFNYKENYIMLSVAAFNERAIKVYEKTGFQTVGKYIENTNGRKFEFMKMKKVI